MPPLARGAAFVDSSGGLATCDEGFLRALRLPGTDAAGALQARAAAEPALAALLGGLGPDGVALAGSDGEPLWLERHPVPAGLLLVLRDGQDAERLEHAARSQGLGPLAGGLSHDVNGPLNTMTLQLALLEEKLGDGAEGQLAARHLRVLRDQVGRVASLVRRFLEVVEPSTTVGGLDLGTLIAEALALLGHDLHRREIQLAAEAPAGVARTGAPPERAARLVLGLLQLAVAATPREGALSVEVQGRADGSMLTLVHTAGATPLDLGYYPEVAAEAAAALGGRLTRASEEGLERVTLLLPRGSQG